MKKRYSIPLGIFLALVGFVVISFSVSIGLLPVYSYNTLEDLCEDKHIFQNVENKNKIRDMVRKNSQMRLSGQGTPGMDSTTLQLLLYNDMIRQYMTDHNVNPQLKGDLRDVVDKKADCKRFE